MDLILLTQATPFLGLKQIFLIFSDTLPVSIMSCYSLGAPDLIVCVLFWYTSFYIANFALCMEGEN